MNITLARLFIYHIGLSLNIEGIGRPSSSRNVIKTTQTRTPFFTITLRRQCWLFSIKQIIMSYYFHIKKKSIIMISIIFG